MFHGRMQFEPDKALAPVSPRKACYQALAMLPYAARQIGSHAAIYRAALVVSHQIDGWLKVRASRHGLLRSARNDELGNRRALHELLALPVPAFEHLGQMPRRLCHVLEAQIGRREAQPQNVWIAEIADHPSRD